MNLLRDANAELTVAWSFAARTVDHDAEAACNAALGYDSPNLPVDAPVPALTLETADAGHAPGMPVAPEPGTDVVPGMDRTARA